MEIMDNFKPSKKLVNKPLRVCIYDSFNKMKDGFSIATGDCLKVKVDSGVLKEKAKL